MTDIIIASAADIVTTLVVTLIGVLGTWLSLKLGQRVELSNVNAAIQEVIQLAQLTVRELQQTVVDGLKASSVDGKLTEAEAQALGRKLIELTQEKMSAPTIKLLQGAAVDVNALIRSAGESYINQLKNEQFITLGDPVIIEE